jgi:TRAP-type C4-dicarboxylate transport system substrate-binding protein
MLYNAKLKSTQKNYYDINNWITPNFVNINKKKTKRLSSYNKSLTIFQEEKRPVRGWKGQ